VTSPHSDRVRRTFGDAELAARYGRDRFPARRLERERRTLATLLPDLAAGPRLDLACGAGRFAALLAAGGPVTGLDASEPMLREAEATGSYARLVLGDAFRLPFKDGAFAAAICVRLLQHLDAGDRRRVLAELSRCVRGRAVVSFFDAGTFEAWRARSRRKDVRSRRAVPMTEFTADCEASGWRSVRVARKLGRLTEHVFVLVEPAR
jgi:ubiquinone/menaquinone biosynthesis C-methylase UbiE